MATIAPAVVKLIELPDNPGNPEAEERPSERERVSTIQTRHKGGAGGAHSSGPATGSAADASPGGRASTSEPHDCLGEDWGEAAVRPQAAGTGRGPESSDSLREDWGRLL